jgi:hypothetical protein
MIKLQISQIISSGETHHRTTSFHCYTAAYHINLSYKHTFEFEI